MLLHIEYSTLYCFLLSYEYVFLCCFLLLYCFRCVCFFLVHKETALLLCFLMLLFSVSSSQHYSNMTPMSFEDRSAMFGSLLPIEGLMVRDAQNCSAPLSVVTLSSIVAIPWNYATVCLTIANMCSVFTTQPCTLIYQRWLNNVI